MEIRRKIGTARQVVGTGRKRRAVGTGKKESKTTLGVVYMETDPLIDCFHCKIFE